MEGLWMLKRKGTYYLLGSPLKGYGVADNFYLTAPTPLGPFTNRGQSVKLINLTTIKHFLRLAICSRESRSDELCSTLHQGQGLRVPERPNRARSPKGGECYFLCMLTCVVLIAMTHIHMHMYILYLYLYISSRTVCAARLKYLQLANIPRVDRQRHERWSARLHWTQMGRTQTTVSKCVRHLVAVDV